MFTVRELLQPETIEEAYEALVAGADNAVLAGCAYLRLGYKKIGIGVDLSRLGLAFVTETPDEIEIGSMTTLRMLETDETLRHHFDGILSSSVRHIVGVQFRNAATLGAPVFSRYGFSDPLTALLALDASVELHKGGRMSLDDYLRKPYEKDILTRIILKKADMNASFQGFRNAAGDYSIVNVAVSCLKGQWRIAAGARPMVAQIADKTSAVMSNSSITAEEAGIMASGELSFGANTRASAAYRQALCKTLAARAIREVSQCRSK